MSDEAALLAAILARTESDTPRLMFADWLDEHGHPGRAELIRVQVELEPIRDRYELPRAKELHGREDALRELTAGEDDWRAGVSVEFRRGFPHLLRSPANSLTDSGAAIRGQHPTIRRVVVHSLNGWGTRLAASDALAGVAELELACWYADADMRALVSSPHLARLESLTLWLGRQPEVGTDAELCRVAARAAAWRAWPALRELVLLDPEGESEAAIQRLAAAANRSAKREVARYERGYPELFPLDGAYYREDYGCPVAGRLPDGRAAIAFFAYGPDDEGEHVALGPAVRTFDAAGAATGEVIPVPLPPDLAGDESEDAADWFPRYIRHLREAVGLVPGFIRVRADGADDSFGPHRGRYGVWRTCGAPDGPDDPTCWVGSPDPNGKGGGIYTIVRNGEFVVGHDAWADKSGHVHST